MNQSPASTEFFGDGNSPIATRKFNNIMNRIEYSLFKIPVGSEAYEDTKQIYTKWHN